MLSLILYQPEIPPNTGNVIRLCANTGTKLHLIHPLGFLLSKKELKRAGLDYHAMVDVAEHNSFEECVGAFSSKRIIPFSTKGTTLYAEIRFQNNDALLLGPETRGLPQKILNSSACEEAVRLPMKKDSRSLNLSNVAAIVVYEAMRQLGFQDLA
ncbi:MAG: tRNA (uridine(34)/cytosine(34)/5-carboxymethylaminomethyluridine(34)-2'-O)-methyltransferase TrmL [Candidatus Woesearchaeota archaeon]|nr:tRNA (uridine(34)/cytosine(34)/5-carboxymethylaminomethyluridine(34)-2'-O)-methyltransferase TrmL [Candidatus Woesearchaeota archaeon]